MIAAAIHNGHDTRKSIEEHLALDEAERLREEDPGTAEMTQIARTQIVGLRSRFEVDLNRPRDKAVYCRAEDAWGMELWDELPDQKMIAASLKEYDEFYRSVEALLREMIAEHGKVVVYDLHTYNHRRDGIYGPPAPPQENPEVNVGTGTMDRKFWGRVVDRFILDLSEFDFGGRSLDVRENVKFQGGYFGQWIHETFPNQACSIAVEVKKFFMDEWDGGTDRATLDRIYKALRSTIPGVRKELKQL